MPPSALGEKRRIPSASANPLANKRKTMPEKPTLHVDCTQPPQPSPQLIAPQPFSAQFNWPQGFTFSPAYPLNLGQQHYPIFQNWASYPDVEFQQDGGHFARGGVNPSFLETCRTSAASSCSWTSSRQASSQYSSVLISSTVESWPRVNSQLGRDNMIATIATRLAKLKRTVAIEIRAMEKMLLTLSEDLSIKSETSGRSCGF